MEASNKPGQEWEQVTLAKRVNYRGFRISVRTVGGSGCTHWVDKDGVGFKSLTDAKAYIDWIHRERNK